VTLTGNSELRLAGPVILNVKANVLLTGGSAGNSQTPRQLALRLYQGALTLDGNSALYALVRNPDGLVDVTGNSRLRGAVTSNDLKVRGNGVLQVTESDLPAPPLNRPPTVEAGADQTITLPVNSVNLQATASDDGLPQGATVTYAWSKQSGPGTVGFNAPTSLTTTASFTQAGTYILRLTASDTLLTSYDELTVTVVQQNQAPAVNASADQTISLPTDTVNLQGEASDDGLPTGVPLAYTWTKVSGPGAVVFGNANSLATTARFLAGGTYSLRLTASDSQLSASDEVTIFVNQAPVVNAGPDQLITLPANTVSL
jgi:hypothetical protein